MMKHPYQSTIADTGVLTYEICGARLARQLIPEFHHGRFRYVYDAQTPGEPHLSRMIALARQGKGLSTYISRHVGERYAARLPLPARLTARS